MSLLSHDAGVIDQERSDNNTDIYNDSSSDAEEPTSNTGAEYQEWPLRGFLKRMTIRKETRYSIDFSLGLNFMIETLKTQLHQSEAHILHILSQRCPREF